MKMIILEGRQSCIVRYSSITPNVKVHAIVRRQEHVVMYTVMTRQLLTTNFKIMAAAKIKIFKINGVEIKGIISASSLLGISQSTLLRKYKENEVFECNGKIVEHWVIKPESKGIDTRTEKQCTSCKNILPNNTDYFRLDNAKVKLGHSIILTSQCIKCKEKQKSISESNRRLNARNNGTTLYAQMPQDKKEYHIKRNNEYSKTNREKINEKCRYRRKIKTIGVINANQKHKENQKKLVDNMPDYYIARLIFRNNKELPIKELLQYPELLDLHRANLKLKRVCNQLKTSTN